jgi:hypothetical protein
VARRNDKKNRHLSELKTFGGGEMEKRDVLESNSKKVIPKMNLKVMKIIIP